MRPLLILIFAFLAWSGLPAQAHEFWLSPQEYQVAPGDTLRVGFRVGSDMNGTTMIYLPNDAVRFDLVEGDVITPVAARIGDEPAMVMAAQSDGLAIVVYETTDAVLTYKDQAVFQRFVAHKAFPGVLEQHASRGLPQIGFSESYRRHCKTLIAVGSGAGSDRAFGLRIEIVAGANPYTDDLSAGMPVQVLLDGAPRGNAQVALYAKSPDAAVVQTTYITDADGRAILPVAPGMEYLVDAVDMVQLPNNDPAAGPVWHSDWASLTFRTPD